MFWDFLFAIVVGNLVLGIWLQVQHRRCMALGIDHSPWGLLTEFGWLVVLISFGVFMWSFITTSGSGESFAMAGFGLLAFPLWWIAALMYLATRKHRRPAIPGDRPASHDGDWPPAPRS